MKLKEFGPPRGSLAPPLDPPLTGVIIYSTHNSQVIGWHLLKHTKSYDIFMTLHVYDAREYH